MSGMFNSILASMQSTLQIYKFVEYGELNFDEPSKNSMRMAHDQSDQRFQNNFFF